MPFCPKLPCVSAHFPWGHYCPIEAARVPRQGPHSDCLSIACSFGASRSGCATPGCSEQAVPCGQSPCHSPHAPLLLCHPDPWVRPRPDCPEGLGQSRLFLPTRTRSQGSPFDLPLREAGQCFPPLALHPAWQNCVCVCRPQAPGQHRLPAKLVGRAQSWLFRVLAGRKRGRVLAQPGRV